MKKHIAIITVVYRNYAVLTDFLHSLSDQTTADFHLFIADASPQKQQIEMSDVPLTILPIENKGYAHGVNIGLQKAIKMGYERFCVINDDVFFNQDFIQTLQSTFETHPYTVFGGKIYYAPGYEYHQKNYQKSDQGKVIWYAGGRIDWNHATTAHIGVDEVDKGQYDKMRETELITGCLFCFDKKIIDAVGFWDEDYFMYYEDADYSVRITQNGMKLYYVPTIKIWHKNAQSTEGSGSEMHEQFQKKSRLRFAMKYAPLRTKLHLIKNHFFSF